MAQIERGANRIYGVERDRPALFKYLRAGDPGGAAGLPALLGFLVLVGGRPDRRLGAASTTAGAGSATTIWDVVRWPLSLALTVFAVAVLFRHAPRRRQPGLSWLLFGAAIAIALWLLASVAAWPRTCC